MNDPTSKITLISPIWTNQPTSLSWGASWRCSECCCCLSFRLHWAEFLWRVLLRNKKKDIYITMSVNTISDIETMEKIQNKVKHDYIGFVNWSENKYDDSCWAFVLLVLAVLLKLQSAKPQQIHFFASGTRLLSSPNFSSVTFTQFLKCRCYWAVKWLNPNCFAGLVGKVRKKLSPEGGRKGGWRKKARAAHPRGPGLEPGEGPQLHATWVG